MNWYDAFTPDKHPNLNDISNFIGDSKWDELCKYIESNYKVEPKIEYSSCSAQKGWNVKYKKSGKSLCTLYPMDGFFIALVVIGEKQQQTADLIITACDEYTQNLYKVTPFLLGGKWLMIQVNSDKIFEDVKKLISTRVNKN